MEPSYVCLYTTKCRAPWVSKLLLHQTMLLYLVRIFRGTDDEEFFKVGVTGHTDPKQRFAFGSTSVIDGNRLRRQFSSTISQL